MKLEAGDRAAAGPALLTAAVARQIAAEAVAVAHVVAHPRLGGQCEEAARLLEHRADRYRRHRVIDHGEEADIAAGVVDMPGQAIERVRRAAAQRREVDGRELLLGRPARQACRRYSRGGHLVSLTRTPCRGTAR